MMEHRTLGRTGFAVSVVGFGAWGIGGAQWQGGDDLHALEALRTALAHECDFIDTALSYGDGHSEKLVAKVLPGSHVTVATKVPPRNRVWPARPGVPLAEVFPADYVTRCAETSMKNLKRRPDLLQLHVWHDAWLKDPDWPALARTVEKLLARGLIGAFGISVTEHEPETALEAVRTWDMVTAVQVIYNVFDQSPVKELFPLCQERNVGVIARVPLDEGGLTGTIRPGTTFPQGDFRAGYFTGPRIPELERRVEAVRPLLMEEAGSMVDGALRFCISHPAVTTVIPGMRTPAHAVANCAAGDGRHLSPGLLARLAEHAWLRNWYP